MVHNDRTPEREALRHHFTGIVSLGLLLGALLVLSLASLRIAYIPSNFSYSTTLAATISEYDSVTQRYAGTQYNTINYSLQVSEFTSEATTLEHSTVTSTTNAREPLNKIRNSFSVDTRNGAHRDTMQLDTMQKSDAYIFAPRNIRKGDSFNYWQATYNTSLPMRYSGTEVISGLDVYRYTANYELLDTLPAYQPVTGFTEPDAAIITIPELTIWIEPQTGWLVKYQERGSVYAADPDTHAPRSPLYYFSAATTEQSVKQQAAYARGLAFQLAIGRQLIPMFLGIITLIALIALLLKRNRSWPVPVIASLAVISALAISSLIGWSFDLPLLNNWFQKVAALNPLTTIIILLLSFSAALLYKARERLVVILVACFVLLIGCAQITYSIGVSNWRPDHLLFYDELLHVADIRATSLSLATAIIFVLLSLAILKELLVPRRQGVHFSRLATGIVFLSASLGFISRLLGVSGVFGSSLTSSVSVIEWLILALLSLVLFRIFHEHSGHTTNAFAVSKALLRQCIVALPIIIIGILAHAQLAHDEQQAVSSFKRDSASIEQQIEVSVSKYTNMLLGVRGLFAASMNVEQTEWDRYIAGLSLADNYPGVQSVGYVKQDLSVQYVTTVSSTSVGTPGYDMTTDVARAQAMNYARDSGLPTFSEATTLLHESSNPTKGIVLFIPIYDNTLPTITPIERRLALRGYVYAALDTRQTFKAIVANSNDANHLNTAIYDGIQTDSSSLLYSTIGLERWNEQSRQAAAISPTQTLSDAVITNFNNRPWTIQYVAQQGTAEYIAIQRNASLICILGTAVYLGIVVLYRPRFVLRPLRWPIYKRKHRS